MNIVKYLNQPHELDEKIERKILQIKRLKEDLYGRGICYENTGHSESPASDAISRAIGKIVDYEHEVDLLIDELVTLKIEIGHKISMMDSIKHQHVLERKYLYFDSNELLAQRFKCSKNHVYKLVREAHQEFEETLIKTDNS